MCGISGFFDTENKFGKEDLLKMNNALAHRGPDASGLFFDTTNITVGLGHRRLSILDLSENGNQPMYSHNKRYVMVYNGEVYNYREIANELKTTSREFQNLHFNSSSDSEVIL